MLRAQFDLSNVSARPINLFGDQHRAFQAAASLAFENVAASMNAQ
jgi:hypothetical protein